MRRLLLAVVLAIGSAGLVVASPTSAHAVDCNASAFVGSANSVRAGQGLPPLEWDGMLAAKASGWAQTMAAAGDIWHSNLSDGISGDWYRLGENVGKGPDTGSIAQALIDSPGHYANLVDPGFRYVGVGVVSTFDTCYVSEVFMELASQPAPSTSAPTAGTPPSDDSAGSSAAAPSGSTADVPSAEPSPPPPPPPPPPPVRLVVALERLRDLDG